ncbi:hypothetical protein [Microcoleus sp. Pol10D4]
MNLTVFPNSPPLPPLPLSHSLWKLGNDYLAACAIAQYQIPLYSQYHQ